MKNKIIHAIFFGNVGANNLPIFSQEELHHIINVRRIKEGNEIYFTNGNGLLYKTALLNKKTYTFSPATLIKRESPPDKIVTVAIAKIHKSDKIEFIVEKLTEIGITSIIIFKCDRCSPTPINMERLQRKAISAIKQSGGCLLPQIKNIPFKELFKFINPSNTIVLSYNGVPIFSLLVSQKNMFLNKEIFLIIGPEGGFSEQEEELLKDFPKAQIGNKILRSETCAILAAGIIINYINYTSTYKYILPGGGAPPHPPISKR